MRSTPRPASPLPPSNSSRPSSATPTPRPSPCPSLISRPSTSRPSKRPRSHAELRVLEMMFGRRLLHVFVVDCWRRASRPASITTFHLHQVISVLKAPRRPQVDSVSLVRACLWVFCLLTPAVSRGAETVPPVTLSDAQRAAIAVAFAPTLVLHPLEAYLPTSPMGSTNDVPEAWRARVARYETLTQDEKEHQAALGYRVYSRARNGATEVIVEYWCYYVYNAFTVRGSWLPYRVP